MSEANGRKSLSCVRLLAKPWTVARQAPLFLKFSRPEYWRGLPFSPAGGLPHPGIGPESPALQVDSLPSEPWWKPQRQVIKRPFVSGCQ